ncbi:Ammonium transporter Rh type A [Labeo rohita]|uniref:Ammonium transporter Rh type A n=1 Tax=Labeo rohita TaxID=84645 RepID=A0ABQ8M5B7_LABRO|nr:Ammonium transporter Rh type A [Labeo rohita]
MAPQYAPSLRSRLPLVAFLLETIFILLFVFFVKIEQFEQIDRESDSKPFISSYAEFQDIHVMLFMGFGFLATFLVRYGFSGSGFNVLLAAMAVQWAVLMNGFLLAQRNHRGKFNINAVYCIMLLHIFGALFGVMVSWVLYREGVEPVHEKEKTDRKTGLFAMFGTLFLWMFWPSFNSALVNPRMGRGMKLTVIYGTYLSLAVSVVMAISVSVLSSSKGKMNMVHIQSSALSGGVAIGVAMTAVHTPWVAMTIGFCASLISALGFRYMKNHMLFAFECHDTCGVLNVHAIPGILGWFAHLFLRLTNNEGIIAVQFAVHHICVLLITVCVSVVMGVVTVSKFGSKEMKNLDTLIRGLQYICMNVVSTKCVCVRERLDIA